MPAKTLSSILPSRNLNSHKGDFGHVLILAGSSGLTGAAYLACQAAVLSGSGLVTLGIPRTLNPIMEVKLTEVMTKPLAETKQHSLSLLALNQIKKILPQVDALGLGPGLSNHPLTQRLVRVLLSTVDKPSVLDADGINALVGKLDILKQRKCELVITPHSGEFSRLLGKRVGDIQRNRLKIAHDFAKKYRVTVVLKGYRTVVASSTEKPYINQTGNPGMASGGCGDVLTGIIASFLGQGIKPYPAAKSAVYIHGLAADYAEKEKGRISLIASDILNKLPATFRSLI